MVIVPTSRNSSAVVTCTWDFSMQWRSTDGFDLCVTDKVANEYDASQSCLSCHNQEGAADEAPLIVTPFPGPVSYFQPSQGFVQTFEKCGKLNFEEPFSRQGGKG